MVEPLWVKIVVNHNMWYKILLACYVMLYPINMDGGVTHDTGTIRVVVSYNTNQVDSVNVKVITQHYKILRDINIVQYGIMYDTVEIRRNISPQDSFHVVVSGYTQNFPCFPSVVDTLTGKDNVYIGYGLNFGSQCTRRGA